MKQDMFSYISEYGNVSFDEMSFNDIDSMIFSSLSFMNFQFINNNATILKEALNTWCSLNNDDKFKGMDMTKRLINLPKYVLSSERYKDVYVVNYSLKIAKEREQQFGAVSFLLPKNKMIIAYMGSDNHLFSWKEDLNMAYLDEIPAQKEAIEYIKDMSNRYQNYMIDICGYSKGGNLALYSALNCDLSIQDRIEKVYCFDAPGFYYDLFKSETGEIVKEKTILYIPRGSIVGKLLKNVEYRSIGSRNISIFQHEITSWKIKDNHLLLRDKPSKSSIFISNKINEFTYSHNRDELKEYIDELFNKFEYAHITHMNDVKNHIYAFTKAIIQTVKRAK